MTELSLVGKIAIFALPVIFAITVHEAAHGYVARMFGDNTAYMLGRVTLNPIPHIDPIGTVLLPLIFLILPGGLLFGWAKPVPVNFGALRHPKKDMLWVAAAGPLSNLAMLLIWAICAKLALLVPETSYTLPVVLIAAAGVFINTILMVLNLVPMPPLDGGRIAVSLLPNPYARGYARIEPYGFFILIGLMLTGILGKIMSPVIFGTIQVIAGLSGVPFFQYIGVILK
jgi:Zn-dependent protease